METVVPPSAKDLSSLSAMVARPRDEEDMFIFLQVHGLMLYYVVLLLLAFWFLLDTWSGRFSSMDFLGLKQQALDFPSFRTVAYLVTGGFLGSILFQIRQLYQCYVKKEVYDYRWVGKYVTAPWESAAMALIVFSIIRGGLTVLNSSSPGDVTNNFAAFGIGALVGFGMRDVVGWMGNIVRTVFVTDSSAIPDENDEDASE